MSKDIGDNLGCLLIIVAICGLIAFLVWINK